MGFASADGGLTKADLRAPLVPGRDYYFWLELDGFAPRPPASTEPTGVEAALFEFPGELTIFAGGDVGEFGLQTDGSAQVARQATEPRGLAPDSPLRRQRLFFRVTAPSRTGEARLRCNLYHQGTLVQSYLVTTGVGVRPRAGRRWVLDYVLSRSLQPAHLLGLGAHRLSLMLNDGPDGTHNLRFFGADGELSFKHDATFDTAELQHLVDNARQGLRLVSWGNEDEWRTEFGDRYAVAGDLARLTQDLVLLAIKGYHFYDVLSERLAGGTAAGDALTALMRQPGRLQLASKVSARQLLPVSLIYDYPLDANTPLGQFQLCPGFVAALTDSAPLESSDCFNGRCPTRDTDAALSTVCPSGFWGFRHEIGVPLSVEYAPEAPVNLAYRAEPHVAVCVSTSLALLQPHLEVLRRGSRAVWTLADTRAATFKLLREGGAHVVYFYCHGGIYKEVPFLSVGPPTDPGITRDNFRAYRVRWTTPRPLVFINGCRTTALEPNRAFDFVSALVSPANAAGVIGTETTVFEPLATAFAEACLAQFLGQDRSIGESIRTARLALLKAQNPLGLVYIPFVVPGLRLAHTLPGQPTPGSPLASLVAS